MAIEIRKRIPVAAGLAGGSADAAGALVACNELWGAGLSQQELAEIAGRVGSDVGFALVGGTAIGLGRGEQVTPALAAGTYHWVLAFAAEQLSTAAVYAACDRLRAAQASPHGRDPGRAGQQAAAAGHRSAGCGLGRRAAGREAARSAGREPPGERAAKRGRRAGRAATEHRADGRAALGQPGGSGPVAGNDLQPAAMSLLPRLRRALVPAGSRARSARSCPGPGRPAPTWPGMGRMPGTWPSR